MNPKDIVDNVVSEVKHILAQNPDRQVCIWWRGYVGGIRGILSSVADDTSIQRLDNIVRAIYDVEENL